MATPAQITANRDNAQHATGPRSDEGKVNSARNSTKYGLFAACDYIPEAERNEFDQLEAGLAAELAPALTIELVWFHEIVSAAWRLRRCLKLEGEAPSSLDRARAQAQNQLVRALNQLRRLQTERQLRNETFTAGTDLSSLGLASFKEILPVTRRLPTPPPPPPSAIEPEIEPSPAVPADPSVPDTKRSQSTPRNAPCPCGSGEKYKRCCGRGAPPVLFAAAA
jgi:hypothetical protein